MSSVNKEHGAKVKEVVERNRYVKKFILARCVTRPIGCCAWITFTIAYMIAFLLIIYYPKNTMCLSFAVNDFKLLGSKISNDYYQRKLSSSTSFKALYMDTRDENDEGQRRRIRRLQTGQNSEEYTYETIWTYEDYYYRKWAYAFLDVFYYSKNTENILTEDLLNKVHSIEQGMKSWNHYQNHSLLIKCAKPSCSPEHDIYVESPPGSLITFLYPQTIEDYYIYDGNGESLCCDIKSTLRQYMGNKNVGDMDISTDFFDFDFDLVDVKSKYLAAVYPFGRINKNETRDELIDFVASFKDYFENHLSTDITADIGITFSDSSGEIIDREIHESLFSDLNFALISLIFTFVLAYVYIRSLFIAFFGLIGVLLSFVPCFAIIKLFYGDSFNFIGLISIWIILGIGCDDMFVFVSSYRRSEIYLSDVKRMSFAFREAGAAMLVTSVTTAFSFYSLCFSKISPVPEFGFFVGTLVILNYFLVMTWFPAIVQCYVWMNRWFKKQDTCLNQCVLCRKCQAIPMMEPDSLNKNIDQLIDDNSDDEFDDKYKKQPKVEFSKGTKIYFTIMRKYHFGLVLIATVLVLSVFFCYTSTQVSIGNKSMELLPENTNWGQLQIAMNNVDIDRSEYVGGGSSYSAEGTQGHIVISRTKRPTNRPTPPTAPTAPTTPNPTKKPTHPTIAQPTDAPSIATTQNPTKKPTIAPTDNPVNTPTFNPTNKPTFKPTFNPTNKPSKSPSQKPTKKPTPAPNTHRPTPAPNTHKPTPVPITHLPTKSPITMTPTIKGETRAPTVHTTAKPSLSPITMTPTTVKPTTVNPTLNPTLNPTSLKPTMEPTTLQPTMAPTLKPTKSPLINPTMKPTMLPTLSPTFVLPSAKFTKFHCNNDLTPLSEIKIGDAFWCMMELYDRNETETFLKPSQIAIVFDGGGSDSILGCDSFNSDSPFYDTQSSVAKWCYMDHKYWDTDISNNIYQYTGPTEIPSENAWLQMSLMVYYSNGWHSIGNKYNFTIVESYADMNTEVVSIHDSITISLLFGTHSVTNTATQCGSSDTTEEGTLHFDDNFDIYSSFAQKRAIELCEMLTELGKNEPIMYRNDDQQKPCFMQEFKEYLNDSQIGYPITNATRFNILMSAFIQSHRLTSSIGFEDNEFSSFNGWNPSKTQIIWISQTIETQIDSGLPVNAMHEWYQKWEDFITEFNKESEDNSFMGLQSSNAYIKMEVEIAFLNGFLKSVIYTIIVCGIVMVVFTQNIALSFLVCLYIAVIVIWVLGIFGAFDWEFGIIEIISVPTVVGLTIDYALHITHAYIHSPFYRFNDRANRAKASINNLASSILCSALTTISSMFLLYFATVVLFSNLGFIVSVTCMFGLALALCVCPPLLMYVGPQNNTCQLRWVWDHLTKLCRKRRAREESEQNIDQLQNNIELQQVKDGDMSGQKNTYVGVDHSTISAAHANQVTI